MLNPFYIVLPELSDQPHVVDGNNIKSLKQWLKQLTTLKQGMVYRLLRERMGEIVKTRFEPQHLEQVIKLIQPYYSLNYEILLNQIIRDNQPNNDDRRKTSDLLIPLCQEFLMANWTLLQSFKIRKSGWRRNRLLVTNIVQLMQSYGDVLNVYYLLGLEEPTWIWLDLNSLYLLSLKNKINDIPVISGRTKINKKATIDNIYKRILLVRITDPYALSKQELVDFSILAEKWAPLAKIGRHGSKWGKNLSGWTVELDQDRPPYWFDESQLQGPIETRYIISFKDIQRLLWGQRELANKSLGRFEAIYNSDDSEGVMTLELLASVEQRFFGKMDTDLARFSEDDEQLFTIGLNSIHQQITVSTSVEDSVTGECLATAISEHELSYEAEKGTHFSVGSLIGFKAMKDLEGDVRIGLVQRMCAKSYSEPSHFQIRQLNAKTYPAGIQPAYSKKKLDVYQRALVYIDDSGSEPKTVLIAESRNIRKSDVLNLLFRNQTIPIKILSKSGIGLGCYLFECEKVVDSEHELTVAARQQSFTENA